MTPTTLCANPYGLMVPVPEEQIQFGFAVYGILIENNQVLLQRHPVNYLWQLSGGIVPNGEIPHQSLRQYMRLATGVVPKVDSVLFAEEIYRIDEQNKAWHLSIIYYALTRPSMGVAGLVDFDNPARPEWVSLNLLQRDEVQFGYEAIQVGRTRLNM